MFWPNIIPSLWEPPSWGEGEDLGRLFWKIPTKTLMLSVTSRPPVQFRRNYAFSSTLATRSPHPRTKQPGRESFLETGTVSYKKERISKKTLFSTVWFWRNSLFCQRYIHRGWHTFLWGSGSNRRQVFIIQLFAFFNLSISVLSTSQLCTTERQLKSIFPHLWILTWPLQDNGGVSRPTVDNSINTINTSRLVPR